MENKYFTWSDFKENFGKEMVSAEDVFNSMVKSGLKDNCLTAFDFTFISDKEENLKNLKSYLTSSYSYQIKEVKKYDGLWELNGVTNEIPVTKENLLFWALDMYKNGYRHDAVLDAYGGSPGLPKDQKFPDISKEKEDAYFDAGLNCYNKGNLSGAIINWSLSIQINPNNPNSYYSRAIAKDELYTWKAALKDYDKALEIAPDFVDALVNRGSVKDDNGDYQGAIADYNKALSVNTIDKENKQRAYFNRGNTKLNIKDLKGACDDWKKALELGADYAKAKIEKYCK